jgi:hypothetical protein
MELAGIDLPVLLGVFLNGFGQLQKLCFSADNPVFWLFVLLTFLLLSTAWIDRKALSFCILAAAALLFLTFLENYLPGVIGEPGEPFDTSALRLIWFFGMAVLFLMYAFL